MNANRSAILPEEDVRLARAYVAARASWLLPLVSSVFMAILETLAPNFVATIGYRLPLAAWFAAGPLAVFAYVTVPRVGRRSIRPHVAGGLIFGGLAAIAFFIMLARRMAA